AMAEDFNKKDKVKVMLVSLKAGGTGLNLVGADIVIHLDPWWNLAAENQASDRAHRIGQTRPVTVLKLVCKGTIEEKIIELQELKRSLTKIIRVADEDGSALTDEDIKFLLS
ncbi:MAG: SWF/SNF helicase family protein, partial [Bacilli bacterium]|nr:SWF/SNF helicase family protein [Bacilli bacterium]